MALRMRLGPGQERHNVPSNTHTHTHIFPCLRFFFIYVWRNLSKKKIGGRNLHHKDLIGLLIVLVHAYIHIYFYIRNWRVYMLCFYSSIIFFFIICLFRSTANNHPIKPASIVDETFSKGAGSTHVKKRLSIKIIHFSWYLCKVSIIHDAYCRC